MNSILSGNNMVAQTVQIKHSWVWLVSLFIFFFNSFLLPDGLTYSLLLTPVWVYLLYKQKRLDTVLVMLLPFVFYAIIHLIIGVKLSNYVVSFIVLISVITFLTAVYYFISNPKVRLDPIFCDIAIMNFFFTLISLILFFVPGLKSIVWYNVPISPELTGLWRLKMFMPEPAHYSFILAPVVIYFLGRMLFFKSRNFLLTLVFITIPLALSFSFGVISCLAISGIIILLLYFKSIFNSKKRRKVFWMMTIGLPILAVLIYFVFPHNPLYVRLDNILFKDDTSARGRTYEAFILAHNIISQKSYWWGIGIGQLDVFARNFVINFYDYKNLPNVVRIPNASAETLLFFGYIGLILRFVVEWVLFFTSKVYKNPYRLWLFIFVFIYQFSGSYITNFAEYLVWMLVFSPVFPEFEVGKEKITDPNEITL